MRNVILAVVVGSRAYGLAGPGSDHDRRGVFAAPTRDFWRLEKPPTHADLGDETFHWEVERFCDLARQANPTVLEVLWSPLVEHITPLGEDLRSARTAFLSRRVAHTYGAYARDQLAKVESRRDRTGEINWKQAMHMIRLLQAGVHVLRTGEVLVDVSPSRDRLLAIKNGAVPFSSVTAWASALQDDLASGAATTTLPAAPDLAAIDQLLVRVREEGLKRG